MDNLKELQQSQKSQSATWSGTAWLRMFLKATVGFFVMPILSHFHGENDGWHMLTLIHQWMPLVNQLGFPIPGWPSPPNTSCADGASGASVSQLKLRSDLHWKVVGAFPKLPFERVGYPQTKRFVYMGKWSTNGGFSIDMLIIQRNTLW